MPLEPYDESSERTRPARVERENPAEESSPSHTPPRRAGGFRFAFPPFGSGGADTRRQEPLSSVAAPVTLVPPATVLVMMVPVVRVALTHHHRRAVTLHHHRTPIGLYNHGTTIGFNDDRRGRRVDRISGSGGPEDSADNASDDASEYRIVPIVPIGEGAKGQYGEYRADTESNNPLLHFVTSWH
jgi:hypothetical protein